MLRFYFLSLLFLTPHLQLSANDVYNAFDEKRRAAVKNLDEIQGVTVIVNGKFDEYSKQCKTDFELRIRQAGIKIKSDGDGPRLVFSCSPDGLQGCLFETVYVSRGDGFTAIDNIETWAASAQTFSRKPTNPSRAGLRTELDSMLNEFFNDYLASR
jgi:hypothetical protein